MMLYLIAYNKVTMENFEDAISHTNPSVSADTISRYMSWEKEFSSR